MAKQGKYAAVKKKSPKPEKQKKNALPFGEGAPQSGAGEVEKPLPTSLRSATFPKGEGQEEKPLTPAHKAWETTKTVLSYVIMALSVGMMLFTALSTWNLNQNDRDLFGYKFFIVRSDSMSATDFAAGDLVVVKEVDPAVLNEGDIIAFISEDPNSLGETFTHKIRSFTEDDFGTRTFTTYGTTTGVDDVSPVPQAKVLGRYQFAVPNVGNFFAFMKTPMGYICCIGIPFLLMLLIQGGGMIASARGLYKEKEKEIEEKHQAELAAQQKTIESQRCAMRKLFRAVGDLQERVEALEKEKQ